MAFCYEYPRPAVTVDAVVICKNSLPQVLLVQRACEPFKDFWALPGGFIEMDETLEEAVVRELKEETSLEITSLRQFKTYSTVGRDPRGRTLSAVFYHIADELPQNLEAQDDAKKLQWFSLCDLPLLAFDHQQIIKDVREAFSL